MNPLDDADVLSKLVLAGVKSPGVVTLSGHERKEKWEVKDGGGQDGASTTRKGKDVAKFTATFELIKDVGRGIDHFAEWEAFLKVLRTPIDGKTTTALDIYHPDLAELDISSVVVESIGGKQHDGKGGAKVVVGFLEYSPPKPKPPSKPKGSKSNGGSGKGPGSDPQNDPNAAAKAELDALLNQAKEP